MNNRQYQYSNGGPRHGPYGPSARRLQKAQSRAGPTNTNFAVGTEQRPHDYEDGFMPMPVPQRAMQLGTHSSAMPGSMNEPLGMGDDMGTTSAGLSGPQKMPFGFQEEVGYDEDRLAEISNGLGHLLDQNDEKTVYEKEKILLLKKLIEIGTTVSQQLAQLNKTTAQHSANTVAKVDSFQHIFMDLKERLDPLAGQTQRTVQNRPQAPQDPSWTM